MKKSRYILMTAFALVLVVALWFIFPKLDHRQPPRSEPQLKIKTDKQNANELKGVIRPDHIVIVVEENHSLEQIIGNEKAPYINELAKKRGIDDELTWSGASESAQLSCLIFRQHPRGEK